MKVGIHANMCDTDTQTVAFSLHEPFRALGDALEGDYGGVMEHLWIDLELIEDNCRPDGTQRHPFRFQKRVTGRSHFGLPPTDDKFNVGHYSVRPNFQLLKSSGRDEAVTYILSLIYASTAGLIEKRKKIGEFDLARFQGKYREECSRLGYNLVVDVPEPNTVTAE
jgi:hypothetical protein